MSDDGGPRPGELRDVEERLVREQEERRRVLDEVSRQVATPAEDALIDSFRAIARGGAPAASDAHGPAFPVRPFWNRPLVLAAAGLLIAAIAWAIGRFGADSHRPNGGTGDRIRLGSAIRCLGPIGSVDAIEEFRWQGELPAGGYYELIVSDAAGDELFREPDLDEARYRPTDRQREALADSIRWRVVAKDATGAELGSDEKLVTLR